METGYIGSYTTGFVLLVASLILLYLYLDRKYKYWRRLGIRSPTFYESMLDLPKAFSQPQHVAFMDGYKKYGRLYGIYGPLPILFVAEPEIIKQILVKDFHIFRNRMKFENQEEILRNMLSVLYDDDWKRVRCIMSPTFSSSKMRKMAILVNECSKNAVKFLNRLAEKNEEVDVKPHFGAFAVDVIATTAFVTKLNSLEDPDNEFLSNARELANRNIPFLKAVFIALFPRLAKLLHCEEIPTKPLMYFRHIVLKIIEEREKTKVKGFDFLQLMMDARDGIIETTEEENKEVGEQLHADNLPKHKTMSLEEIVSQCVLFFGAGHETTAITLSFVAYHLALNTECQERLAKEVRETWEKHGAVDYDVVSKMPYLDAVIYEAMRKNSTAVGIVRMNSENYALGDTGVIIPKGNTFLMPICAMHYDPDFFPNPEKFDPERFMPENKHLIKPFTYMPFGEGPRNCIGMRFIMMVMKLCLSYILKDIKFVATEETRKPLEYYMGQGVLQVKQMKLKVVKR